MDIEYIDTICEDEAIVIDDSYYNSNPTQMKAIMLDAMQLKKSQYPTLDLLTTDTVSRFKDIPISEEYFTVFRSRMS